jgi:hypothetical protein
MVIKWLMRLLEYLTSSIQIKWAIRSGVPNVASKTRYSLAQVDYGALSETAEVLVNYEGLAIRSLLKVQSFPIGNTGGAAWTAYTVHNSGLSSQNYN